MYFLCREMMVIFSSFEDDLIAAALLFRLYPALRSGEIPLGVVLQIQLYSG